MNASKELGPKNSKIVEDSAWYIFLIFLRLGLTSFGGPVAHIAYFHNEFVQRRKWFSDQSYSQIVGLCQFMPGPASSQVGLAIGLSRAGYRGAFAAWFGFTMPSAIAMTLVAIAYTHFADNDINGLIHGLKIVAVAIIAQAIWGMFRSLCPDLKRGLIMISSLLIVSLLAKGFGQITAILISGVLGVCFLSADVSSAKPQALTSNISKKTGLTFIALFFVLLFGLPLLSSIVTLQSIDHASSFYRAGSLVFGGGHVVLPLLEAEVVASGQLSNDTFLMGYGAAQAVPGPLFTFASFIGASLYDDNMAWFGSALCLIAIFIPAFLLVAGALPFWQSINNNPNMQTALAGANAGVVGLLLAVMYDPIWVSTIHNVSDFGLSLAALIALTYLKLPSWAVVIICGLFGAVFF